MNINVFSPTYHQSMSYGRLANELVDGLRTRGVHVNTLGLDMQGSRQRIRPSMGGFLLAIPPVYKQYGPFARGGVRIAVTMLETTRIPRDWVEVLNNCTAVIVPAAFMIETFRASGVRAPIHVVPLGVSDVFKAPRRRQYSKPFTVLVIGDRGTRKNWWDGALAFHDAFGDDPRFRLIIKSHAMPHGITNPNIDIIEANYSDEEMRDLYCRAHVMLFPARGEGFGFPPREFAATGGVAIATNWSGTAGGLRFWGVPLPVYDFEPGYTEEPDLMADGAVWAVPRRGDMVRKLREVARNYSQYADFAMDAAHFVDRAYRWQRFSDDCLAIYTHYLEEAYDRHVG